MSYSLYQPSGRVPFAAILPATVCGILILPSAFLYARLQQLLPAVLDVALSFAFAFIMATGVKQVCVRGKVRSPRWIGGFGLVVGFGAWYFQWAAWSAWQVHASQGVVAACAGTLQMALQPAELASHVLQFATSSSGVVRYLMAAAWLGELWMLLFFPYYMGKMRAEAVFDEAAGKWADHVELPVKFRQVDRASLLGTLDGPPESLADCLVAEADEKCMHYARLRVYRCGGRDPLVSVVSVDVKDSSGVERVLECFPGMYLSVPAAELDELLAATDSSDPPALATAIDRLQAGDFDLAHQAALPFVGASEKRLYCDANRICAIACSQLNQWDLALNYWKALFTREATAHNALQVATSAVMTNDAEEGAAWSERAHAINGATKEMPSVAIITNMLSALTAAQAHSAAMPYLEQLRDFYTRLHVTDPTFLFGHRIPLFHVFLEKSSAIVRQVLGLRESREWYAAMLPHLDERGKAELTAWLNGEGAAVAAG